MHNFDLIHRIIVVVFLHVYVLEYIILTRVSTINTKIQMTLNSRAVVATLTATISFYIKIIYIKLDAHCSRILKKKIVQLRV